MIKPSASLWTNAPEPGIPEPPAIVTDSDKLWLAYFRAEDQHVAVLCFSDVIDHRLLPINDEEFWRHRYSRAGLQLYSFNELADTEETLFWSALKARHWVISFKDNTLDVVARSAEVIHPSVAADSPLEALLGVLSKDRP